MALQEMAHAYYYDEETKEKFYYETGTPIEVANQFNSIEDFTFFPSYLRCGNPIMIYLFLARNNEKNKCVLFREENTIWRHVPANAFFKNRNFEPINLAKPHHRAILFGDGSHLGDIAVNDTVLYTAHGTIQKYAFVSRIQNGHFTLKNEKGNEFLFNVPAAGIIRKIERDEQVPPKYRQMHFRESQMELEF
ncbi:hypothetical protein CN918_30885 [Priestia megaterium]|nr:hypothetical protein CN918_30885 [Priestia megaterium]